MVEMNMIYQFGLPKLTTFVTGSMSFNETNTVTLSSKMI